MDKILLEKANNLQDAIKSIEDVNVAFKNDHWVMFNIPDKKDFIQVLGPLYEDLNVFLQEKKAQYIKQFNELA